MAESKSRIQNEFEILLLLDPRAASFNRAPSNSEFHDMDSFMTFIKGIFDSDKCKLLHTINQQDFIQDVSKTEKKVKRIERFEKLPSREDDSRTEPIKQTFYTKRTLLTSSVIEDPIPHKFKFSQEKYDIEDVQHHNKVFLKKRFEFSYLNSWMIVVSYCLMVPKNKPVPVSYFRDFKRMNTEIQIEIEYREEPDIDKLRKTYKDVVESFVMDFMDPVKLVLIDLFRNYGKHIRKSHNSDPRSRHRQDPSAPRMGLKQPARFRFSTYKRSLPKVSILDELAISDIFNSFGYNLEKNFVVTLKIEGFRKICMIRRGILYFSDDSNTIKIDISMILKREGLDPSGLYVFDGEWTDGKFYPFDCLVWDSSPVMHESWLKRFEKCKILISKLPKIFKEKPFLPSTEENVKIVYQKMKEANKDRIQVDGLVFIGTNSHYMATKSYKWKPQSTLSIDFYVKESKQKGVFILYSGVDRRFKHFYNLELGPDYKTHFNTRFLNMKKEPIVPIPFTSSALKNVHLFIPGSEFKADIDNQICEFMWDNAEKTWVFGRVRTDRIPLLKTSNYFGNYYSIAETTFMNMLFPVTIKQLLGLLFGDSSFDFAIHYFNKPHDKINQNQLKFNNFVKGRNITNILPERATVVDLCCGRGQDLLKLMHGGVKHYVGIDNDIVALKVMIQRKHNIASSPVSKGYSMKIQIIKADLVSETTDALAQKFRRLNHVYSLGNETTPDPITHVDLLMCNFAVHYFTGSQPYIRNFANIIKFIRPEKIMFTYMDGLIVKKRLKDIFQYSVYEKGLLRFSIKKKYRENSEHPDFLGMKINVFLPFSNISYDEFLVKTSLLKKTLDGFNTVLSKNFEEFKSEKINLNENDKKIVSAYHVLVLRLEKKRN